MADVAPELLERIQELVNEKSTASKIINDLPYKARLSHKDLHRYAEEVGRILSEAYLDVLTEANLPNGTLYRNIAERILSQTLQHAHGEVMNFAEVVQTALDEAKDLGIQSAIPDFPDDRIRGLIDKASNPLATIDEQRRWLGEPVINNTEAFADDFIRTNAQTRARMGLKTTITRIVAPGCCEWCDSLGGIYEYGDEPKEVYQRHEYCRCITTFQSDRTSQNVWSKTIWESTPDEIERRVSSPGRITASQNEIQSAVAVARRDQVIDELATVMGKSTRDTREYAKNLNVAEIEKEITKKRRSLSRRG